MKKCTKCNTEKSNSEFWVRGSNLLSWCKICVNKNRNDRQRNAKLRFIEYKGGACQVCGIIDHPAIYDFHHVDPDKKEFMIGTRQAELLNDKMKKELDKCLLLCSNCHRKIHAKY